MAMPEETNFVYPKNGNYAAYKAAKDIRKIISIFGKEVWVSPRRTPEMTYSHTHWISESTSPIEKNVMEYDWEFWQAKRWIREYEHTKGKERK